MIHLKVILVNSHFTINHLLNNVKVYKNVQLDNV